MMYCKSSLKKKQVEKNTNKQFFFLNLLLFNKLIEIKLKLK